MRTLLNPRVKPLSRFAVGKITSSPIGIVQSAAFSASILSSPTCTPQHPEAQAGRCKSPLLSPLLTWEFQQGQPLQRISVSVIQQGPQAVMISQL